MVSGVEREKTLYGVACERGNLLTISLALAALTASVVVRGATMAPAQATIPGQNGKIAFQGFSSTDADGEIYTVHPDGTGLARLTNNPARDEIPAQSPDGAKIAFSRAVGDDGIWVMNADGSDEIRLTNAADSGPTWSPDGAKIAFTRSDGSGQDVWVMNADGSDQTKVTPPQHRGNLPAWSPDGTKIAFTSENDIWIINVDGSNPTQLTHTPAVPDSEADWSPDGKRIAFESNQAGETYDIYKMNADGSNVTRLTETPATTYGHPSWSPDGSKITFVGAGELWTINADGSRQTNLPIVSSASESAIYKGEPDWGVSTPPKIVGTTDTLEAGTLGQYGKIAFSSDRGGSYDIYAVDPDGSSLSQLTDTVFADYQPAGSPDGTKIAFQQSGHIAVIDVATPDSRTACPEPTTASPESRGRTASPEPRADTVRPDPRAGTVRAAQRTASSEPRADTASPEPRAASPVPQATCPDPGTARPSPMILTENRGGFSNTSPAWSPDGTQLAFTSDMLPADIYTMNPDGSNQTNLTRTPEVVEMNPDYSPNGAQVCLYRSAAKGTKPGTGIYTMNADGSNPTRLTDNRAGVGCDWSPDGSKIAYAYHPDSSGGAWPDDVYVMNTDGSGKTNLTSNPARDLTPRWSPDGTKISFASDRDGDLEVYTMDPDGSDVAQVTTNTGVDDVDPYWLVRTGSTATKSRGAVDPSPTATKSHGVVGPRLLVVVGTLLFAMSVGLYVMIRRRM